MCTCVTLAGFSLAGLCSRRRFTEAWHAYGMVRSLGYSLKYNTYQSVLQLCIQLERLSSALEVFGDLQGDGRSPNQVTYSMLISALGKQRRRGYRSAQLAYELWQELQGSSLALDAAAMRTGMKACADVGRPEEAERLLESLRRSGDVPDARAYNIVIKAHAKARNLAALRQALPRMRAAGVQPSYVTYNTLIDGFMQADALDDARAATVEATAAGIRLDAWSYTSLIKGHVQAGDVQAASQVVQTMQRAGVQPTCVTYSILVDGHVRAGNLAAACELIDTMVAAGVQPSSVTYNSLLRGYAFSKAADPMRAALQLLDEMQTRGVAPAADTFNTLMSAAVSAGEPQLAVDLFQRLLSANLSPDGVTYTVLIQAHSLLGQVPEAVAAFEALSRDPGAAMDLTSYNAMVAAFARSGEMAAAESMLQSACAFATRKGLPPPVESHGAVVAGYARLKDVQLAVDTVRRFHASGGTPDVPMLDILADVGIRTGEFKTAMQAVRAMELLGVEVDKAKYKNMVVEQMQRQKAATQAAAANSLKSSGRAAWQRQRQRDTKNVHLERFKFWLGLPNRYYDD